MAVHVVRVSEHLWERAGADQRREWRALLGDLPAEKLWPGGACAKMICDVDDKTISFRLYGDSPSPEIVDLARTDLEVVLADYNSVISTLADAGPFSARAEALDMGKRVMHDTAARVLSGLAPTLADGHDTYRRLFSLVVSLVQHSADRPGGNGGPLSNRGARTGD